MTALSVVVPVYRGAEELCARLPKLSRFLDQSQLDYEIIIVDDGSDDGSNELLLALASGRIQILLLEKNVGKFGALKAGMSLAKGRCRLFTDADLPYDYAVIPYMVDLINSGSFHIVVGDRTLPGSIYRSELGWLRGLATRVFTVFVRLLVTGGLHDTQCGIKALRGDVADAIFPLLKENGFAGDVELLYVALSHNLGIRRVPARLVHQGPSSVSALRDGFRMLRSIIALRPRRSRGDYESTTLTDIADQTYWTGKHSS